MTCSFEETVLVDNEDVTVIVKDYDFNAGDPAFGLLLKNKTDKNLTYMMHSVVVDGLVCENYWSQNVSAGQECTSDMTWYPETLEAAGINYIETVKGDLDVYESETDASVYYAEGVAWEVTVEGTDEPAAEPVKFDHGFDEQEILTGDVVFTVKDYDPAGSYGDPLLVFYMENHAERSVRFMLENVMVNGVECDPYWAFTVPPETAAYSDCEWWMGLEESGIDAMEEVTFTVTANEEEPDLPEGIYATDEIARADAVIDLTGVAAEPAAD